MMQATTVGSISSFLQNEFSRVSQAIANEICEKAKINPRARPSTIVRDEAELLEKAQYIKNNPLKRWPEINDYAWVGFPKWEFTQTMAGTEACPTTQK
jgi:hypothetical protein